MYMLIKDLQRSGVHVYANKGLTARAETLSGTFYIIPSATGILAARSTCAT